MLKKTLFAAALLVATVAIPAVMPQKADAQVFIRGRGFGIGVGTPYYGGGYYGGGYYGGYRPYYYGYPSYGYYNYGYYPRYYGRYWR